MVLILALICISLMANDGEHLSCAHLYLNVLFGEKSRSINYFLAGFFVFLLLSFDSSSHTL